MNRFISLLQRVNDKLDLPQPEKSRILLEIAADLQDMYQVYLDKGLGEEEAVKRTEEKFSWDITQIHPKGPSKELP